MDNYFAAVEEKHNPPLRNVPFAVCGDPAMRHSIVMSKNAMAKQLGVRTGLSYSQAKQICPTLDYVVADMPKYLAETKLARKIYAKYAENIIPYGMDESWLVLPKDTSFDEAAQLAELIRIEIMYSLGLSASVGVSFNYIFSKLGSDFGKPNKVTLITRDNYKDIVWRLPASELLFVGSVRRKLLKGIGINTIGDIAQTDKERLIKLLGKVGYDLWCFANGDDKHFNPINDKVESVGNTITPPEDLRNNDEVSAVIYLLVSAISARLKKHDLKAWCVSISIRDSNFNKTIRQSSLRNCTNSKETLFNTAFALFTANYKWGTPVRSIGVRCDNLYKDKQLSLFGEEEDVLDISINEKIVELTGRLGQLELEKTATLKDW